LFPGSDVPIVLAGFHPLLVVSAFGIVLAYQQWIHTETITKLGWFDAVFNSPSNHRVHHATQPEYIDKNYGGILIIWDRLFGTYQKEGEAPRLMASHSRSTARVRLTCTLRKQGVLQLD